jgi:hypothetical protein
MSSIGVLPSGFGLLYDILSAHYLVLRRVLRHIEYIENGEYDNSV